MGKIRVILLDYDLTLMDNIYDFYDAINEALKYFNAKPIPFNRFYYLFINYRLHEVVPSSVEQETFWRYFRRIYPSRTGLPVKGLDYFLYWVRNLGLKNIIISGRECHELKIHLELEKYGLRDYIDEVYTLFHLEIYGGLEEELFDKSWLIKWVLEKHGTEPGEAVYIGDYSQDYYSSRKVNVEFIGLALSKERAECLQRIGVKYIAKNYYEVLLYLLDIMKEREN